MSFGKATVHGIYMLCYLCRQDVGTVTSAATLAKAVDVPPEHARKILMRLCAAGLATSTNGRSGGYASTRSMEDTSVLDVLEATNPVADDGVPPPRMCAAAPDEACSVQPGLADLQKQMRGILADRSLAAVIGHRRGCLAEEPLATVCAECRESADEVVPVVALS
ncbi:MAG: hypothetical protein GY842_20775 [bacterium]|nr:hypothetical protein [bacterium]